MSLSEQLQEHLAQDTRNAWETALGTEGGRLMVWSILESCGVFQSSYNAEGHAMAYHEGRRAIGLQILNERVLADPDRFAAMMREHAERCDKIERAIQKENEE